LKDQNRVQEAILDYQRALYFYLHVAVAQEDQESLELKQKIADLFIELENVNLPAEILYQLFDFFERNGEFVLVEDVVARLLQSPEVDLHIITDLISYYERLLESSELDSRPGGLSREQVKQKLDRLKNWGV
jgi:hypothetical protein